MTTNQTAQLRTRYARMYAVGNIALVVAMIASVVWTQANTPAPAMMDVSAIMATIDTAALPVQGHVDAF